MSMLGRRVVRRARRPKAEHTHGRLAERRSRMSLTVMKRPMLMAAGVGWFLTRPGCLAASKDVCLMEDMRSQGCVQRHGCRTLLRCLSAANNVFGLLVGECCLEYVQAALDNRKLPATSMYERNTYSSTNVIEASLLLVTQDGLLTPRMRMDIMSILFPARWWCVYR